MRLMRQMRLTLLLAVSCQAQSNTVPPPIPQTVTNSAFILVGTNVYHVWTPPNITKPVEDYSHLQWDSYTNLQVIVMATTNLLDTNSWYFRTNVPITQSDCYVQHYPNYPYEFYRIKLDYKP